jgi:dolichol-phosphate mannosyltransferase
MTNCNPLTSPIHYSVIIPFFNEAENIPALLIELKQVMLALGVPYEVILVDDGSQDRTAEVLQEQMNTWPECRLFRFGRNQGQASALYFGFKQAAAPALIIMDGDGQNDPKDIPALLAVLGNLQADMVMGVRAKRQDSYLRRAMSRTANSIRSRFLGDGVHDTGCGIKVLKSEVAESFIPLRTLYSFMPALAVAAGYVVIQHAVNHRPRLKGQSKYGLGAMPSTN